MNDNPREPNARPPFDELEGALRRAVEAARSAPVPPDAVNRSVERACHFSAPANGHFRLFHKRFFAVTGVAAAVLVGALAWLGQRAVNAPSADKPLVLDAFAVAEASNMEIKSIRDGTSNSLAASNAPNQEAPRAAAETHLAIPDLHRGHMGQATPAAVGELMTTGNTLTRPNVVTRPGTPALQPAQREELMLRQALDQTAAGGLGGRGGSGAGMGGMAGMMRGMAGKPAAMPTQGQARFGRSISDQTGGAAGPGIMGRFSYPDSAARGHAAVSDGAVPARSMNAKEARNEDERLMYERDAKLNKEPSMLREAGRLAAKKGDALEQKKEAAPQVWQRDRQRPTFARVYVGNGNSLELVSLQVTVTVEGPRARTVVDHVFHNPHPRVLEGTFEYPLPSGASASYFAMFPGVTRDTAPLAFRARTAPSERETQAALARLTPADIVRRVSSEDWGAPQEARVVSKAKALETYEEIVRGRIDPALLEYAGGNTFSGRVFPIPPRGFSRVLIAYEELLPYTSQGVQYRFPLPDCKLSELQFTLDAGEADCRDARFVPEGAASASRAGRLSYTRRWTKQGPGGDAVFTFTPPRPDLQVVSGRQGESGPLYFYTRVRPELPVAVDQPFAEHAIFLLDTSLSEHPDRFDVSMKLLRKILESDESLKRFNILTFDVNGRWVDPKGWMENTRQGRVQALARLDGIVLEGATDLAAALDKLVRKDGTAFAPADKVPVDVFLLSDGQITWGDTDVTSMVSRFEGRCRFPVRFHCYRTGLGADNLELFTALTRRGGGVFNCFGDADIPAAALAHRSQCFQIDRVSLRHGPETSDVLVAGRQAAVYPGGELIVAGRANQTGRVQLVLEGLFQGKRHAAEYVLDLNGAGELAPRGWAEIAVAALLALNDPKLDSLVTAYCQQFGIGSRVASFLVLENANDYKRLNLEEERGKTVPGGDLGLFLEQMWMNLGKVVNGKEAFERFLDKVGVRVQLLNGPNGARVQKLLSVLGEDDFALPEQRLEDGLRYAKDLPPAYLDARQRDRRDVSAYLREARRRVDAKDVGGAVRVLSSVIEEYPARADALRLVGYRLLALDQANQAVRLFQQVQQQRPFEPHSYRDLARSLEECGKYGWAAVQYEIVLAGAWHNRFRDSLKSVAQEEYVRMMRQAVRKQAVSPRLADQFGERLEQLASVRTQSDLRVTITWNTDATDVDLWVIEPDGTKCFYQHTRTKNGGELSQDQTQGYGPERYQVNRAVPGTYTVIVHYYRANPNLLAGESHVNVAVARNADTPNEEVRRYNVILKKHDEQVEVCKVRVE